MEMNLSSDAKPGGWGVGFACWLCYKGSNLQQMLKI